MAASTHLVVYDEPAPKERPRHTLEGRVYTPPKTKLMEWRIRERGRELFPLPSVRPIRMHIHCLFTPPQLPKKWYGLRPHVKLPDLDNCVKLAIDALTGVAYARDTQVVEIYANKDYAWEGPARWEITVECLA